MNTDIKNTKSNKNILVGVMIVIIITLFLVFYFSNNTSSKDNYVITLKGNKYIVLTTEETYTEPGFEAKKNNEDVTNSVKVTNEIKNTPGVYRIIYQIGDYYEYRYVEIKKAIDPTLEIILELSNDKKTNEDVIINVTVNGETFSTLTLPDKSIVNTNTTSFVVKENGVYTFEAINDRNETFTKEISIDNIDKIAPTGTCTATLTNSNTVINVEVSDNDKVTYSYYDNGNLIATTDNNSYTITTKSSDKIKVTLEDEVLNKTDIACQIIDKRYYEQVKPSSSEKIVFHGESDTFKTYIVNRSSYYLTYIWVKDAYTQLNKMDSPEYGKNLYQPKKLLEKARDKYNLKNKIMVGFNASGFYLKGTFDAASVKAYPAYDKTSVGTLVITDGKVVRNAYSHAVKTWFTVGVNKDNQLLVFEDTKSADASAKKAWSEKVINSGIRNTFSFSAPLMENGKKTGITTSMPGGFTDKKGLQIICQINDNNFLLFTSKNETRNKAIDEFTKLGCKTAMNLDGGGSVALFYKDKNSDNIVNVLGGARALPEAGYFTE